MAKSRTTKPAKKTTSTPKPSTSKANSQTSEIRDLIEFIAATGLNEVNLETKELKLHIKREPDQNIIRSESGVMTTQAPAVPITQQVSNPVSTPQVQSEPKEAVVSGGKKTVEIKSPMIGTFYRSPNPDSPPFVSVGDRIEVGQTVCIIEAMKLFNEIESEVSGTLVKLVAENSTPVEYDQVLYLVELD